VRDIIICGGWGANLRLRRFPGSARVSFCYNEGWLERGTTLRNKEVNELGNGKCLVVSKGKKLRLDFLY
jgi:hypothetical protein